VIVMVGHDQLRSRPELLDGKIVLDTRHVPGLESAYRL
jgi:hypothetical protein